MPFFNFTICIYVHTGYEYDGQTVLTRFKKRVKEVLYDNLKGELRTCNVNFEISSWYPSLCDGLPTNTVIIVPIFKVSSYETLDSKMQRASKETKGNSNSYYLLIIIVNLLFTFVLHNVLIRQYPFL